jgi:hypothetical protein
MYKSKNLLSVSADSKTVKGEKLGFLTGILYIKPDSKICPNSKAAGCAASCLYTAGRGAFDSVRQGRINKGLWLKADFSGFMAQLCANIETLQKKAKKQGLTPVVRLNGTSDLDWQNMPFTVQDRHGITVFSGNIFQRFPGVQFYDYTKVPRVSLAPNYHLTFSYSAEKAFTPYVEQAKGAGLNLAVVFRGRLPETFLGLPVISGDDSDLRFLDSKTHEGQAIVGLLAKGKAKKETNSFVIDPV